MLSNHLLSKRAVRIIELAKEAAKEYEQGYVGTEHLLLGIIREGTSTAAKIFLDHGANEDKVKEIVDELTKERLQDTWVLGRLPGTPHLKDVLSKAAERAGGVGNWQVGSIHLLHALLSEKNTTGLKALQKLGISIQSVSKSMSPGQTIT